MENITKQYKKHLAGFIEYFEEDVQNELYTEIKDAIEYALIAVSENLDVDIDDYVDEDTVFQNYLERRSRKSVSKNPWYTDDNHKIIDEWKP